MTEVNLEHLRKVYVICETLCSVKKAKAFLEKNNCIGMKAHLYDTSIDISKQIKEFNIAVIDTGNKTFVEEMVIRYKDIGHYIKIFKLTDEK